jgi:hypothetical protein
VAQGEGPKFKPQHHKKTWKGWEYSSSGSVLPSTHEVLGSNKTKHHIGLALGWIPCTAKNKASWCWLFTIGRIAVQGQLE